MKIFSPAHFLRQVSMPMLRAFTDAHPLGPHLSIDWEVPADTLASKVNAAVEALHTSLENGRLSADEVSTIEHALRLWHDDLRRVHLLSNELAGND